MAAQAVAVGAPAVVVDSLVPLTRSWSKVPRELMRGKHLTPTEKALLLAILDVWNCAEEPAWFPATNVTLQRFSGLNHRTFLKAKTSLIAKGVISTKNAIAHRLPTRYHLHPNITQGLRHKTSPSLKTSTLVSGAEVHPKFSTAPGSLGAEVHPKATSEVW